MGLPSFLRKEGQVGCYLKRPCNLVLENLRTPGKYIVIFLKTVHWNKLVHSENANNPNNWYEEQNF